MGGSKKFIDKRHSKTYTLVFRSTDDDAPLDDGERVLVDNSSSGAGAAAATAVGRQQQPPTKDPRALYAHFFGGDSDDEECQVGAVGGGGGCMHDGRPRTTRRSPAWRAACKLAPLL
jgi:hypothetical protein